MHMDIFLRQPHNRRVTTNLSEELSVHYNMRLKTVSMTLILILTMLTPFTSPVTAAGGAATDEDMQAQNAIAIFNAESEDTTVMWENVNSGLISIAEKLQESRYLVYRSPIQMNTSMIMNNEIPYIGNISACVGPLTGCAGQIHNFEYDLPPSQNGTFYYGIATNWEDVTNGTWTITAFMELGVSQIGEAIYEFTHDITAPFAVNATYYPELSQTKINWINLNQLSPGSLLETGDNAYVSMIYRHTDPATRENWAFINKTLVGNVSAGISTFTFDVPPETDEDVYYSVTYMYLGYEDTRFIGGVNTMDANWPVREDNVAPRLVIGGVFATFAAEPLGGTGNTTITWNDLVQESGATYHVWRSGAPFTNTSDVNVEHIASVSSGIESFRYQVERGTLGNAYYSVTVADSRGNHNTSIDGTVLAGPVVENAFHPWIAEPTNVQAQYVGEGWTNVSWIDQIGAEGESYHVWHSWTRLSESSNLSLEATLVATVPDGVQYARIPVPEDKDRMSYYCVTSVARYNHLGATYEDTGFAQNCIQLPINEDTLAPAPIQLSAPLLQNNIVQLSWINSLAEDYETYTIWRHLGVPLENNETGNISDADGGWEILIDKYEPHSAETGILREVYLEENLNRNAWYAMTVADSWGNWRDAITNRSNLWLVHEDTTGPNADVLVSLDGGDGQAGGAQKSGDYRLHIHTNEDLAEFPHIRVYTCDYDGGSIGNTFTPDDEVTRATPFLSSSSHFIWDFSISSGMNTNDLCVEATLIDMVGNTEILVWDSWTIDAVSPTIELFAPSSENKYLYGDDIRIRGVVTDDVALVEVKYRVIDVREFYEIPSEWELVTDVTPSDAENNILIFDMKEPSATFIEPGNHKLEIMAIDTAGNEKIFYGSFFVDHCYENLSGMTFCESGSKPFSEETVEPEAPPDLSSPPYVIIIAVAALNVLLLLFTIILGILAAQDPSKKKKKGDDDDDMDEDDDWMLEFMGGGDSGAAADAGLAELEAAPSRDLSTSKKLEDQDDPFATEETTTKRRRKSSSKSKSKKKTSDDDDDDDDDWGDDDDEVTEKKRRPAKKRKGKSVKRKTVKRKNN